MQQLKRVLFLLVAVTLLASVSCAAAQEHPAHQLWHEMASAGNVDLTDAWDMMGMYTFGETTGNGYVTLTVPEGTEQFVGSVSFRNYPGTSADITNQFFPMLRVLMVKFCEESDLPLIDAWLSRQQHDISAAYTGAYDHTSHTQMFLNYELYIKYDVDHNELYTLITPIRESQYLMPKAN